MARLYSTEEVKEILVLSKLREVLPRRIEEFYEFNKKRVPEKANTIPSDICLSFLHIESSKKIWIEQGWVNLNGRNGLVPIGPGAVPEYPVLLTKEYIHLVDLSKKFPEFSILPSEYGAHYERAMEAIKGLNHDDFPKNLTLESRVVI